LSEIRATTISDTAGTGPATLTGQYAAKAWANWNGSGTVAIRGSGNLSSITDTGTGTYTVNFTTAFSDTNYAVTGWAGSEGSTSNSVFSVRGGNTSMMQTGAVKIRTVANDASSSNTSDLAEICISIFR
jgi:hypothetical protein